MLIYIIKISIFSGFKRTEQLAVNVMDFDGLDEDEYTALAEEEASARQRQSSVW